MEVVSYKCPNCSAGLSYDPSGVFICDFCASVFDEPDLKATEENFEKANNRSDYSKPDLENEIWQYITYYSCPNCGAGLITDSTTVASFCLYCHNPVIVAKEVSGELKPDYVIPFSISEEKAKNLFNGWCSKKPYLAKGFYNEERVETLKGVYYPFWILDIQQHGHLNGIGKKSRSWKVGDFLYEETSVYDVSRSASIDFSDITFPAIKKNRMAILNGIMPFDLSKKVDFSMSYLSGFFADKKNQEKEVFRDAVNRTTTNIASESIKASTLGYDSVRISDFSLEAAKEKWSYVLFPVWMLTYNYKDEEYYFAINGSTGKVAGRVPTNNLKLFALFLLITIIIAGLMSVLGIRVKP